MTVQPRTAAPPLSMSPLLADTRDLVMMMSWWCQDDVMRMSLRSLTWSGARRVARSRRCPAAPPHRRRSLARRPRLCSALPLCSTWSPFMSQQLYSEQLSCGWGHLMAGIPVAGQARITPKCMKERLARKQWRCSASVITVTEQSFHFWCDWDIEIM